MIYVDIGRHDLGSEMVAFQRPGRNLTSTRGSDPSMPAPGSSAQRFRYDFHAHTYLTDGTVSATDMWTTSRSLGHRALAITDHVGLENPEAMLRQLREEAEGWKGTDLITIIGVEITKAPPRKIAEVARRARSLGAEIVIVHGETIYEVVPEGTNHAAIESGEVDILAHPGLLSERDAELAAANGTILEISGRRGHCLSNGHVARLALQAGARLVVDSDAHGPDQLLTRETAERLAKGAGLSPSDVQRAVEEAPLALLKKLGKT